MTFEESGLLFEGHSHNEGSNLQKHVMHFVSSEPLNRLRPNLKSRCYSTGISFHNFQGKCRSDKRGIYELVKAHISFTPSVAFETVQILAQ